MSNMPVVRYPQVDHPTEPDLVVNPHFISLTFIEGSQNPDGKCEYPDDHWQAFVYRAGQQFAESHPEVRLG